MNNKDVDLNAIGDYLTDAIEQFDNIIDYVVDGGTGYSLSNWQVGLIRDVQKLRTLTRSVRARRCTPRGEVR